MRSTQMLTYQLCARGADGCSVRCRRFIIFLQPGFCPTVFGRLNKPIDGQELSPRRTTSDTKDAMFKRVRAGPLMLIVLFSTAGLVLSLALAFYRPEVTAGYLEMVP
ncbi:hypothetical protein EAS61_27760 [Bradyrhizobium zhanjiangense]|uniref:Uncharacterized protein n=1 Tax=Bradyrhizobium zhanjiangense TaxID=1325107 RepID=A0A4Q0QF80_9BRAD|nr:hypothetical protein EAS61_27760 [Bradyrhizobium zhanjiangense]